MKNNLNEKSYLDKLFTYEVGSRRYERLDDFPYDKLQGDEGIHFMWRENVDSIFVWTHKVLTQEVKPDEVLLRDYDVTLISTPDEPDATLYNIEVTKLHELLEEFRNENYSK